MTTDSLAQHAEYDQIEEAFNHALDESLAPRGPEMLYDLVASLNLPAGAMVLDVGCGTGRHSYELARRFGFNVVGVDPILGRLATGEPAGDGGVRFEQGTAESLPAANDTFDLIWCRDVLSLVPDLTAAFAEFARVLKPGGKVLAYMMFVTDRLMPAEAEWFLPTMGCVPRNVDPGYFEDSAKEAGLILGRCTVLGSEWGEFDQETSSKPARKLLHAARLLRDPELYIRQFGQVNYDIALGDCLWHVYRLIGKTSGRVYVLSKPG